MNAFPSPAHQTGADDPAPDPSMEEILASIRRIIADDQAVVPPSRPSRPSAPGREDQHYSPAPQQARYEPQARQELPRQELPRHEQPRHEQQPFTIEAEVLNPASQAETQRIYSQPAPHQYAAPQPSVQPQQYAPQTYAPQPAPRSAPQYAPQPAPRHAPPDQQPVYAPPPPPPLPVQHAPVQPPSAFSAPVPTNNLPAESSLLSAQSDSSVTNAFEALTRSMMLQNSPFMEETVRDLLRPMLKQWLDDNLPPLVERLVRSEIERVARGGRQGS